jgi:hypothetical protein
VIALLALAPTAARAQGPAMVEVGEVRAVYWPGDERLATSLAEYAAAAHSWPGLGRVPPFPLTLLVTRSESRFDSLTRGRLPAWTGAAAFPRTHTIVLRVTGDPFETLQHEMAHLVLSRIAPRAPLWFAEGYAVCAAHSWGALDALSLNWRLVRGQAPGFQELDRQLRSGESHARAAYGLAAAAVLYLQRLGGDRGLTPLLDRLKENGDFDQAVRAVYLVSLDELEGAWHRDLRRRYGWLLLGTSVTLLWGAAGLVVGIVWWRRRRTDRVRRAALDEGWNVEPENGPVVGPEPPPTDANA